MLCVFVELGPSQAGDTEVMQLLCCSCKARGSDLVQQSQPSGPYSLLWLPLGACFTLGLHVSCGADPVLEVVDIHLRDLM